jgi:hypothetical protein
MRAALLKIQAEYARGTTATESVKRIDKVVTIVEEALDWERKEAPKPVPMILYCPKCPEVQLVEAGVYTLPGDEPKPVPMILYCPMCTERHIDEGEFETRVHHTHSCQDCGHTWRPAVVPTVGVDYLPGFRNESPLALNDEELGRRLWAFAVDIDGPPDAQHAEALGRRARQLVPKLWVAVDGPRPATPVEAPAALLIALAPRVNIKDLPQDTQPGVVCHVMHEGLFVRGHSGWVRYLTRHEIEANVTHATSVESSSEYPWRFRCTLGCGCTVETEKRGQGAPTSVKHWCAAAEKQSP